MQRHPRSSSGALAAEAPSRGSVCISVLGLLVASGVITASFIGIAGAWASGQLSPRVSQSLAEGRVLLLEESFAAPGVGGQRPAAPVPKTP